jgi:chromosomal replication initiation ATPase DnaA
VSTVPAELDQLPDLRTAWPRRTVEAWLARQQLSLEDLRGPSRKPEVVEARRLAIRFLRRHGFSFPQIGRYLNRDNSTVQYHVKGRKRPHPGGITQ